METTLFIGQQLFHLDVVSSTNEYAHKLIAKENPSEGAVIFCDQQTHGKGQHGNSWESTPNQNLTLSIILNPNFLAPTQIFLLNKAISLGLFEFVRHYLGDEVKIKWPNDILYRKQKLAGLLIENSIKTNQIHFTIAGIGININQNQFETSNATSFKNVTGKTFKLDELLKQLFKNIEIRYLQLKSKQFSQISKAYLDYQYGFNQLMEFQVDDENIKGIIIDVDNNGELHLDCEGIVRKFSTGEIRYIF